MKTIYPLKMPKLTMTKIPDEVLASIGRLIRACAELENLVMLHICNLTGTDPMYISVLLGRTPISRQLEIAAYLAKIKGDEETLRHTQAFLSGGWDTVFKCRNAVAHGIYRGVSEPPEQYVFELSDLVDPGGQLTRQAVLICSGKLIASTAIQAEAAVPSLEKHFGLSAWREKQLQRPLEPHPKAQSQQSDKQGQERQPGPSRGKPLKQSARQRRSARMQAAKQSLAKKK